MTPEELIRQALEQRGAPLQQDIPSQQVLLAGAAPTEVSNTPEDIIKSAISSREPGFFDKPFSPTGLFGPTGPIGRLTGFIADPIAKDPIGMSLEVGGATTGAALGTAVAGAPGAIAGGAGGARLGRLASNVLLGREPESDMTAAGISGAAGPALGVVGRHTARWFSHLPTISRAIKRTKEIASQTERRIAVGEMNRLMTRAASQLDYEVTKRASIVARLRNMTDDEFQSYVARVMPSKATLIHKIDNTPINEFKVLYGRKLGFKTKKGALEALRRMSVGEYNSRYAEVLGPSRESAIYRLTTEMAEKAVERYREVIPRELRTILTSTEPAVKQAAAAVPPPQATSGAIPAALGFLFGGSFAGMEAGISAGAAGYLLGQMRGRAAYKLAQNEAFVKWAMGVTPQEPLAQAALTFITDVMVHSGDEENAKAAEEFYNRMIDFIEEFPEAAFSFVGAAGAEELPEGQGKPYPDQGKLPIDSSLRIPRLDGQKRVEGELQHKYSGLGVELDPRTPYVNLGIEG